MARYILYRSRNLGRLDWFLCSWSHRSKLRSWSAGLLFGDSGKNLPPCWFRLLAGPGSLWLWDRGLHFSQRGATADSWKPSSSASMWAGPYVPELGIVHSVLFSLESSLTFPSASSLLSPARDNSLLLRAPVMRLAHPNNLKKSPYFQVPDLNSVWKIPFAI